MIPLHFRVLALSFILSLQQTAIAGSDIAPFNGGAGVEIADSSNESQLWYPLSPGQSLDYAFTGPGRLWLYVRSGASPRSGVWNFSTEAELSLLIGSRVVERIPQVPALDGFGGLETDESYPWIARGVLVDIPAGDSAIKVEAALNGPPILLRIVSAGQAEAPTAIADLDPPEEEVEEELPVFVESEVETGEEAESTGTILDLLVEPPEDLEEDENEEEMEIASGFADDEVLETEPSSDLDWLDDDFGDEAVDEEQVGEAENPEFYDINGSMPPLDGAYAEPEPPVDELEDPLLDDIPEAQSLGTLNERFITSLQAAQIGGSLGLGAPLRGDSPSPYIGAAARIELMPILWDGWNLDWGELYSQVNIGWYRVGVNSDLVINDVHAGQTELTVQYATSIIPMELSVGLEMPFAIGPVIPIAAIGTGLYLSMRAGDDGSEIDASPGYSALLGGEMEIWSGVAGVAFSHTGTSGSLGRLDESGNEANEKLSVERLDLTYLTHF